MKKLLFLLFVLACLMANAQGEKTLVKVEYTPGWEWLGWTDIPNDPDNCKTCDAYYIYAIRERFFSDGSVAKDTVYNHTNFCNNGQNGRLGCDTTRHASHRVFNYGTQSDLTHYIRKASIAVPDVDLSNITSFEGSRDIYRDFEIKCDWPYSGEDGWYSTRAFFDCDYYVRVILGERDYGALLLVRPSFSRLHYLTLDGQTVYFPETTYDINITEEDIPETELIGPGKRFSYIVEYVLLGKTFYTGCEYTVYQPKEVTVSGMTYCLMPTDDNNFEAYLHECQVGSDGEVTIPDYITVASQTRAESLQIPVTAIADETFLSNQELKSVKIGDNVTIIGRSSFQGCSNLNSAQFGRSLSTIEQFAFNECTSLTSIKIPDSVTSIGHYAFWNCTNLKTLHIDGSLSTIPYRAFQGCRNLESITGKYASDDNRCLIVDGYLAAFVSVGLTSYSIPNTVTKIGEDVFRFCSALTSVEMPKSLTSIGEGAFSDCTGLTSVTIPDSVTTIGPWAFSGCTNLKSLHIGSSVSDFERTAFRGCRNMESITGKFASDDNRCLIVDGDLIAFASIGLTSYSIPCTVKRICEEVFRECRALTLVEIPNTVTAIEESAFYGCSGLTSLKIPDSVTKIGRFAFSECSNLKSLEIGNSLTAIEDYVFEGDSNLTSVVIPNSVKSIGMCAFHNCKSLASVELSHSITSIGEEAFWNCHNLRSVVIPNSVKSIDSFAFLNCDNLMSVVISNSATNIGYRAFDWCVNLNEVISLNPTPPSIKKLTFNEVDMSTCILKVPAESVDAYKTTNVWEDFENIVALTDEELTTVGIKSPVARSHNGKAYSLDGKDVGRDYKGIVIRNGKKVRQ